MINYIYAASHASRRFYAKQGVDLGLWKPEELDAIHDARALRGVTIRGPHGLYVVGKEPLPKDVLEAFLMAGGSMLRVLRWNLADKDPVPRRMSATELTDILEGEKSADVVTDEVQEFVETRTKTGWRFIGDPKDRVFAEEGEALAAAWAATPPGEKRPEVVEARKRESVFPDAVRRSRVVHDTPEVKVSVDLDDPDSEEITTASGEVVAMRSSHPRYRITAEVTSYSSGFGDIEELRERAIAVVDELCRSSNMTLHGEPDWSMQSTGGDGYTVFGEFYATNNREAGVS